jgi:molybdopterin synthase sulfur carrier subunit
VPSTVTQREGARSFHVLPQPGEVSLVVAWQALNGQVNYWSTGLELFSVLSGAPTNPHLVLSCHTKQSVSVKRQTPSRDRIGPIMQNMSLPTKATSPGHFKLLYFAAASSFTKTSSENLSAPLPLSELFDVLDKKYPGMRQKVLESCAVTLNLEYVDMEEDEDASGTKKEGGVIIQEGDEVAIIPPVSSG